MAPKMQRMMTKVEFKHVFTQEKPGKLDDYYQIDRKVMGEGSYGTVFKGVDRNSKSVRAIKAIDFSKLSDPKRFEEEVGIQQQLDHPHIVKLYEVFKDAKRVYLVMEMCTGGELFDRIIEEAEKHEGAAFDEIKAATYMQQILGAMQYLHKNNFVHRDIKPENFLMQSKDDDAVIKVIDFGLAKAYNVGSCDLMKTKAGTPYYVAPQVLQGKYNEKCDVWSCGVICYILMCGYPPFFGDTDDEILRRVKRGTFDFPADDWGQVSKPGKDFIRVMLTLDPEKRPSCEELLASAWINDHSEKPKGSLKKDMFTNMKSFSAASKFKKVGMTVIAKNLNDKDIAELKTYFELLDANKDGTITVNEMKEGLQKHKLEIPKELEDVMSLVDTDGSKQIDYTEFLASTMSQAHYKKKEMLWAAFRVFDLDGDGSITKAELQSALGDVADDQIAKMIQEVDTDGDGTVSYEEFCTMMTKD